MADQEVDLIYEKVKKKKKQFECEMSIKSTDCYDTKKTKL